MNREPLYEHDCNHCTHVGSTQAFDVYHCRHHTLIIRFSSDGPDYTSSHPEIWRKMIKNHPSMSRDDIEAALKMYDEYMLENLNA